MSDDLIRRSDAIKAMEQRYEDILRTFKRKVKVGEKAIVLDMIGCLKNMPSADRPQGKWKAKSFHEFFCNNCGFSFDMMKCEFLENMKYCPNCGARMKGVGDD